MSIVRWDIDTTGLPLKQASPTQTIGMKYNNVAFNNIIVPVYDPLFWGEVSEILISLNNALTASYLALFPTLPNSSQYPPYFGLNDGRFTLYVPIDYITSGVEIFLSRDTFNDFLPSMPIKSSIAPISPESTPYVSANGQDIFLNLSLIACYLVPSSPNDRAGFPLSISSINKDYCYLPSVDTASALYTLSSIHEIQLTSSTLPIRAELDSLQGEISSSISNKVSDFVIQPANIYENRIMMEYLPTAEYRWIELVGTSDIRDIRLEVFYKTFRGTQFPLLIFPGSHMSIKIAFTRV